MATVTITITTTDAPGESAIAPLRLTMRGRSLRGPGTPALPPPWVVAIGLATLLVLYAGSAALLVRFDLDGLLFPRTPAPPRALARTYVESFQVSDRAGNTMLVRRFGEGDVGCVLWFPGRREGVDRDARDRFEPMIRAGFVVQAAAYPGQDGAPGRSRLAVVQALAAEAVSQVATDCGPERTVVMGTGLGAWAAAAGAARARAAPAGLVLESASPSLSAVVRAHLREQPLSRPLALLPVSGLIRQDASLAEFGSPGLPTIAFQGTDDAVTPLAELSGARAGLRIVAVAGATHEDVGRRAAPAEVRTMIGMVRAARQGSGAASGEPSPAGAP